jgi:O-6-methylguanine DNA methyltransferase
VTIAMPLDNLCRVETLYYSSYETNLPVGTLTLAVSERGLAVLSFRGLTPNALVSDEFPLWRKAQWVESREKTADYVRQMQEYLTGTRKDFEMPLDLRGTDFQMRCWNALLEIPYGETRTYADIAREVKCPKGFRAVGMANNRNPIAIVVPCHRVVETNGKLGGYGGGLPAKEWLLELEGSSPQRAKSATQRLF